MIEDENPGQTERGERTGKFKGGLGAVGELGGGERNRVGHSPASLLMILRI